MAEHVQITVRSTSRFGGQEDQLIFCGTGTLEKLPEGWHLRYEAANEADGSTIVSDVKLETATHRAVIINEADSGGYGLLLDDSCADQFFTIEDDAEALLTFISNWLTRYKRWLSPKYLVGESYGCIRSAVAAGIAGGGGKKRSYAMAFDGLVLIGNSITTGRYFNRDIPCEQTVLAMPTVAAINWYHNHPSD